ncbi:NifB/NifX family molybdenum-iron cluster-binding protein [Candidatus Bathyarchaeota archaeon]|nr:NifB/NifX family molybdenum-iron cluster-binding protein [Candidatus Bathyarchaeota archaeon]
MSKLRIAFPTKGYDGLDETISEVFGKAKTLTLVDVEDGRILDVTVIENPGASLDQGSGPLAVKLLADGNVDLVMAVEIGPGASSLIKHHGMKIVKVDGNKRISEIIRELNKII